MNILFLSPWFPFPLENGSKIRIYNLIKNLSRHHDVRLISFIREGERIDSQGLEGICNVEATIPFQEFNPRSLKSIAGFLAPIPRSVVDCYSSQMAKQVEISIKLHRPALIIASEIATALYGGRKWKIPCILDEMQLGLNYQLHTNSSSYFSRARKEIYRYKLHTYTKYMVKQYDACTVASEIEHRFVSNILGRMGNIYVLPNGVDIDLNKPANVDIQPDTLIYQGALTFSANLDAMSYFTTEIFPIVQREVPQVVIRITGRNDGVDLSHLSLNENVKFTGFVPDIRSEVSRSWACVVPLRLGGGTRLKILEAMALGTPVVASSKAVEGLYVTPGYHVLIGDTPEDFAFQVIRLLKDEQLRDMLSRNGRELVEKNYAWIDIGTCFEQIIDSVMNDRKTANANTIRFPE